MGRLRAAATAMRERFGERARRWALRRQGPLAWPVHLDRRRLYILPTRAGVGFAALVLTMLAAGLNYANSLALLLTFLLAGFALVAMQQCHRNLLGLRLTAASAPAAFAHSPGRVRLALQNPTGLARLRIGCALERAVPVTTDLAGFAEGEIELPFAGLARGVRPLGPIKISSTHPFGLFRAWSWVDAPIEVLVYPRPRGARALPAQPGPRAGSRARLGAGTEEWLGLRPFREGDSPRQVDWKAYAREAPLLVKEYGASGSARRHLRLAGLESLGLEAALEQLARWVLDAEARGEPYSLEIPGTTLAAARGREHRHRCLEALCRYGEPI